MSFENKVTFIALRAMEEIYQAIQVLRERHMLVLDLAYLATEEAQRAVDWIAGSTYAIDGKTFWIDKKTFLFTPSNFQVIAPKKFFHPVSPKLGKK
jgi:cell division inhibitor SepF